MKNILTVSVLALSILIAAPAYSHEEGNGMGMMTSSPHAAEAPFDIQYLDTMAEHHREGIKMFQMAIEKSENQEIKTMAQKMIDDQKKEIPELKSMRDDIQPSAPEAVNMEMPGMMSMDMKALDAKSGSAFDHAFLDMTIKHHQGAVDMSKNALKSAQNKSVKDKAQVIIDMQGKEIAKMKDMREAMK
ncbi:MAG: DUF305 domain-containing protein [Dongiaceae bacterium]|jgi:uncharacterized protein (DUF305 family)